MLIKDIAVIVSGTVASVFLKTVRAELDDVGKQEILKNGLYHVTPNESVSAKIISSQHLKPARGAFKNINSYGRASVCFFGGTPGVENYMKNLLKGQSNNPYVHPNLAVTAIKVSPKTKEELVNYKVRALQDNAILYEGYCILPEDEIKSVHLVPDLVREEQTGEPIINKKIGKYDIAFREALESELSDDGKTYIAKDDYLKFMAEEREKLGYIHGNGVIARTYNSIVSVAHVSKIESQMSYENFSLNIPKLVKRKFRQLTTPRLDMPIDEKIHKSINEFDTRKKNPYRSRKFGETVAKFQTQGLKQLSLKDELESLTTSDMGKYFRKKFNQIDKKPIVPKGIHGIDHNNRVATLAMIIAKNEGILENDLDDKTKDILLSAAYYHDIGRRKGPITDNYGPHSKNSARKVKKMDLYYLNGEKYTETDKRMLQAIIEAHEGKDKSMQKICKKYKVPEESINQTIMLMQVIKDADALDRVRLDVNLPTMIQTDLNPNYLRLNTSKQLLNVSYQLENITKKVSFDRILAYKTEEQREGGEIKNPRDQFIDYLKQGVSQTPEIIDKAKKVLTLSRDRFFSRLTSKKLISKMFRKENQLDEEQFEI